jgi:hypothetical protein
MLTINEKFSWNGTQYEVVAFSRSGATVFLKIASYPQPQYMQLPAFTVEKMKREEENRRQNDETAKK